MQIARARRPIVAAALTLLAFCACVAMFMPPLSAHTDGSVTLTTVFGLAIAVTFILHLIFIGLAAQRLGRSIALWVVLALVTFPIGSIIGLVLFEWFSEEQAEAAGKAA